MSYDAIRCLVELESIEYLSYEAMESWLYGIRTQLQGVNPEEIVSISRGGNTIGTIVAHITGKPLSFMQYDRSNGDITLVRTNHEHLPKKIILCEDFSGKGITFLSCVQFWRKKGVEVVTLCAAYDSLSRLRPDFCMDLRGKKIVFPWENMMFNPRFQEDFKKLSPVGMGVLKPDHVYTRWGIGLEHLIFPQEQAPKQRQDLLDYFSVKRQAAIPFDKTTTGQALQQATPQSEYDQYWQKEAPKPPLPAAMLSKEQMFENVLQWVESERERNEEAIRQIEEKESMLKTLYGEQYEKELKRWAPNNALWKEALNDPNGSSIRDPLARRRAPSVAGANQVEEKLQQARKAFKPVYYEIPSPKLTVSKPIEELLTQGNDVVMLGCMTEKDRNSVELTLKKQGWKYTGVVLRDKNLFNEDQLALYKAYQLYQHGVTDYIEADHEHAQKVKQLVPWVRVYELCMEYHCLLPVLLTRKT